MEHRTRVTIAALATIGLFLCVQLGALALLDHYVAANVEPVEDPSNPGNVAFFFVVILVATAAMLVAIRFDLERLIQGFVVLSCGWIAWLVLDTLAVSAFAPASGAGGGSAVLEWVLVAAPIVAALALVVALLVRPEWYVVDAAGLLLGAGAAGLFGLAFTPQLTIVFLVILAVYDAVSVYGTEHMLTLAEGVSDLNLPILFVVPTVAGYSLLDDAGPATVSGDGADGEGGDDEASVAAETPDESVETAAEPATNDDGVEPSEDTEEAEESAADRRDALYIGLGDAVMPTILVASAVAFRPDAVPLLDVPLLAVTLPALTAMVGTLAGLAVLLALVLRGRAHAGLPLLNGGAIAGYLLGSVASGVAIAEALGLPL